MVPPLNGGWMQYCTALHYTAGTWILVTSTIATWKQGPMVPTLNGGWMQHCTAGRGRLGGDDCSECSDYRGGCLRWNTMVTMVTEEPITAPSWLVTPYQGLSYPTNSTFALLQEADSPSRPWYQSPASLRDAPQYQIIWVFLNIVQTAFDPPWFWTNHCNMINALIATYWSNSSNVRN